MFCRGDWYAQGNHARDAASRRRPGDDEGMGPHRQAGTFVYSSPELCLPFRTITSHRQKTEVFYHISLEHTSRHDLELELEFHDSH